MSGSIKRPHFLCENNYSYRWRNLILGFLFVIIVLLIAFKGSSCPLAVRFVDLISGGSTLPSYAWWDIGSTVSMTLYFIIYYFDIFFMGIVRQIENDFAASSLPVIMLVTVICTAFSTYFAMKNDIIISVFLLVGASLLSLLLDLVIMIFHETKRTKFEYGIIIRVIDLPMLLGFSLLSFFVVTFYEPIVEDTAQTIYSSFTSGAVAFQIIIFNALFALVTFTTAGLTTGRKVLLISPDGDLCSGYDDFCEEWQRYWNSGA